MREPDERALNAVEAGQALGLPADVVRALTDAGYLVPSTLRGGVPRYDRHDLDRFRRRARGDGHDVDAVLDTLADHVPAMAGRAVAVLEELVGDELDDVGRARIVREARRRIEAILAVGLDDAGVDVDDGELAAIGADAAREGLTLAAVLVVLRVSRDLLVRTAVEVTAADPATLAVTVGRIVPAVDRLCDAVARGYWEAVDGVR